MSPISIFSKSNNVTDRYLIIGADSLIGSSLIEYLTGKNSLCIGTSRKKISPYIYLDLEQNIDKTFIPEMTFTAAFLCASITSVKYCEEEPKISSKTNVDNVLDILNILAKKKIYTVYLSSNLVFDGSHANVQATAQKTPSTQYGIQKKIVETGIENLKSNFGILRLTKVIESTEYLVKNWYKELLLGKKIYPYTDVMISPCSLSYVLKTLHIMALKKIMGVVQISAIDEISYQEMAECLAKKFNLNEKLIIPNYSNVNFERPPVIHSSLDCKRLNKELNIFPGVSRDIVEKYFERIIR